MEQIFGELVPLAAVLPFAFVGIAQASSVALAISSEGKASVVEVAHLAATFRLRFETAAVVQIADKADSSVQEKSPPSLGFVP